jgi:hypothetical protein
MKWASSPIVHNAEPGGSAARHPSNQVLLRSLIEIEEAAMKQMSRPEFEAYEKRIETLLSGFEANIEPWERHDYDQIAAATRDVVNIRREYLEQNERQAQTTARARRGADREAWGAEHLANRSSRAATTPCSRSRRPGIEPRKMGSTPATPKLDFVLRERHG